VNGQFERKATADNPVGGFIESKNFKKIMWGDIGGNVKVAFFSKA
jgi:hypothetical protein